MSKPAYAPGDRVRTRAADPPHHTRLPGYARGHAGVIVEPQGTWPRADERARGIAGAPAETVYAVRFSARELWGSGSHDVTVDLWESYLEPAEPAGED